MSRAKLNPIIPATTSGTQLAALLNARDDAENSGHRDLTGSGRPNYATEGMIYATGSNANPTPDLKLWLASGPAGPDIDLTVLFGVPPGTLRTTAEVKLSPGWLWANGAAVSRTTYPALFNAICPEFHGTVLSGSATITGVDIDFLALGGTHGGLLGAKIEGPGMAVNAVVAGASLTANTITISPAATAAGPAGSAYRIFPHGTTSTSLFNLPNCKDRIVIGRGDMGSGDSGLITPTGGAGFDGTRLGVTGGLQGVAIAIANLPPHTHTGSVSNNGSSVVADSTPHTHALSSTPSPLRQIHTSLDQAGADNHSGHAHGPPAGTTFMVDVADGSGNYTVGGGTRTGVRGATAVGGGHDHVLTLSGATDDQLPLSHTHSLILSLNLTIDQGPALAVATPIGNVQPSIVENVVIKI